MSEADLHKMLASQMAIIDRLTIETFGYRKALEQIKRHCSESIWRKVAEEALNPKGK